MYFFNLVLQFYSRKIFLEYLGAEILGLNTTAVNILQFLNLAELGVWAAIAPSLYKPLNDRDTAEINRIVTLNGLLYKRIALIIIVASLLVMALFPLIFKKMELPLIYAYASFGVLLFSSLLGYFVNYRQFVLSADQKDYKIQYSYKLSMSIKVVAQIIAMKYLSSPYLWWLILEVVFAIVGSVSLNAVVRKTYPFLNKTHHSIKELTTLYPEIPKRIKQLFIQKISGYVLFQSSPLIIYGIANMTLVTLYGNYLLIVQGIISLMAALFNSMVSGIGNLVVTGDTDHSMRVFFQLYSFRFYIIGVLGVGVYTTGQEFIAQWLGQQYLLSNSTLLLLTVNMMIYLNRYVIYDYLSVYGYFGDVWASILEIALNIGLSIILGIYWGLNGIITGVLITNIVISMIWKPIYLFKIKLKQDYRKFINTFLVLALGVVSIYLFTTLLFSSVINLEIQSLYTGIGFTAFFSIAYGVALYYFYYPFRNTVKRFV